MKLLSHDLSARPQIEATVATPAAREFKSIMGNRPDGEAHDQPAWTSLVAEAEWHGVSARQLSVVSGEIGPDHLKRFAEVLHDQPAPIAAHCRMGPRSAMLWALVNPDGLNVDERIAVAATQSYDLAPLRHRMEP